MFLQQETLQIYTSDPKVLADIVDLRGIVLECLLSHDRTIRRLCFGNDKGIGKRATFEELLLLQVVAEMGYGVDLRNKSQFLSAWIGKEIWILLDESIDLFIRESLLKLHLAFMHRHNTTVPCGHIEPLPETHKAVRVIVTEDV